MQPWRFITDPATNAKLRHAAEAEEREFYDRRTGEDWGNPAPRRSTPHEADVELG